MRLRLSPFDKLALTAWGALALASRLPVSSVEPFKLCLFRALTGLPCPGCGMGHALLFAFQGRWAESLRAHPLGPPLLAVWTAWAVWGLLNAARGRAFSERFPRLRPIPGALALAALLGVYAARLARADAGAAFDRRSPNDALPGFGGLAVSVPPATGKPVPDDLAAAALKWGNGPQLAKLAARPAPDGSFRFAVIGDAEPGRFAWERAFAPSDHAFRDLLGDAESSGVSFALQLGDMVSKGTAANYRAHFRDLDEYAAVPLIQTIGNHDRSRPNGAATKDLYAGTMGALDFSFDHGGWRFVSVDTSDRRLRDDQLAWLRRVVPFNGRCVIFTHVPPRLVKGKLYSPKKKGFEDEKEPPLPQDESYWRDVLTAYFEQNSDGFGALLAERKVARVYMGHVHAFGVARVGPTLLVLSGGGGSPLYPLPPGEPKRKMTHWLEVSVSGDSVRETVHELNGDVYPMPLP